MYPECQNIEQKEKLAHEIFMKTNQLNELMLNGYSQDEFNTLTGDIESLQGELDRL